jgi:hypothetical protein
MTVNLSLKHLLIAIGVCALFVVGGVYAYHWYHPSSSTPSTQYEVAQPIKEVEKVKHVKVPGPKQIVTIEKEKVVEKLKLPDEIASDPSKNIIATAQIPPYEGKTNAIGILDTKTGEGSIQIKQEPLPFIAFPNEREVGIAGYYSADLQGVRPVGAVDASWTPIRIGKIRVQIRGEINSRPESRAGVRAAYRW